MNKKAYLLIIVFILLNVCLRFPFSHNELGVDSYYIHGLSKSIQEEKIIGWNIHPLSLFGMYPYSYAVGVPILVANISLVIGLNLKWTIWLMALFIGLLGALGSYLLATKISKNKLIQLLIPLIFSTSIEFLYFTTWTISSRGMFLALVPLYIYFLISTKEGNKKYFYLTLIVFILEFFIHQMYVFLIPLTAAFILLNLIENKFSKLMNTLKTKRFSIILVILAFLTVIFQLVPQAYQGLSFLKKIYYDSNIVFLAEYARAMGFWWAFFAIGFIFLAFKKDKTFLDLFLLLSATVYLPLLKLNFYMVNFYIIFGSIIAATGFIYTKKIADKFSFFKHYLALIIICSIFLSILGQIYHPNLLTSEKSHTPYMDYSDESLAEWMSINLNGKALGSDHFLIQRVNSENPCLFVFGEADALNCGFIDEQDISATLVNVTQVAFWNDGPYVSNFVFRYHIDALIKYYDYKNPVFKALIDTQNVSYYVTSQYVSDIKKKFLESLEKNENKIFSNGDNDIWYFKKE